MTIIITGNPADGLEFIGPFNDTDEANQYAEDWLKGSEWWTVKLDVPNQEWIDDYRN